MVRNPPEIRVGPAGWSYDDWAGIVYPASRPRDFHEAAYLAQFLDAIEINTTFYHPPTARVVAGWVSKVAGYPRFTFTAKLWQRFTHERNANRQDEKVFKDGVKPLVDAGRLGALLLQFPWSFKNIKQNREYLSGLFVEFMEYPLVLEVRHSSWNHPEVFAWLGDLGVGFCNIDQPIIGRSLGPSERVIPQSGIGYVRLHGRNYEQWFSSGEHPEERYNYLYTVAELKPWVERIRRVSESADVTYVITNNHFQGKAVVNALQLVHLLKGEPVCAPESLVGRYPELATIALPPAQPPGPQQPGLLFATTPQAEKKV